MKLHRYFARRFLVMFLLVFFVFAIMSVLIDMIEQFRMFSDSDASFVDILRLTVLNVPGGLYRILPLIAVLGSLALFVGLARTSELVIARAAGRSALVSLIAPSVVALVLGVLAVTVLNPIVAATSRQYAIEAARLNQADASIVSVSGEGLWMRQGGPEGQIVIRAAHSNPDGTRLGQVTFMGFDPSGHLATRIEAKRAELTDDEWLLEDAKIWRFDASGTNPEDAAVLQPAAKVATNMTPSGILDSFGAPSTIPIWELPSFIKQLKQSGFSARNHQVWFQSELSQPLMLLAMLLIGAAFSMRHARFGNTGSMVLMALAMGFTTFFIRNFAQILGENGQLPITLAAFAPPLAAILLSLSLILHWEDG